MTPSRRPVRDVRLEDLPEFLSVADVADLLGVKVETAVAYGRSYGGFPKPAFNARAVWRRDEVLAWLATGPRLLRSRGPSATVDAAGVPQASGSLPTYLTRADIATMLDVAPRTVSDAIANNADFPARAFGSSTVLYPAAGVLEFLRRRELGAVSDPRSLPADDEQLLSMSQIAAVLGLSDRSLRTYRSGRDAEVFPQPAVDEATGRVFRPARFHRDEVVRYVRHRIDVVTAAGGVVPESAERFVRPRRRR